MSHPDYAGCRRATLAELGALEPGRWALEPKVDGIWVELRVGAAGRVTEILGRNSQRPRASLVADWLRLEARSVQTGTRRWRGVRPVYELRTEEVGVDVGLPAGRYVAELEALTERGEAARAEHGCARLWLRDVFEVEGSDCRPLPMAARRAVLEDAYKRVPEAMRARLVLIPQRRAFGGGRAYAEEVIAAGGEGVVAHRLDAAYGERGGSLKCKGEDSADLVILTIEPTRHGGRRAVLGACDPLTGEVRAVVRAVLPAGAAVVEGMIVEVTHAGSTRDGSYRHPRLATAGRRGARVVRIRDDKAAPDDAAAVAAMGIGEAVEALGLPRSTLYRWEAEAVEALGLPRSTLYRWEAEARRARMARLGRGLVDAAGIACARRAAGLPGRRPRLRSHAGWEPATAPAGLPVLEVIDARGAAREVGEELRGWLRPGTWVLERVPYLYGLAAMEPLSSSSSAPGDGTSTGGSRRGSA